ncbi:unnamed protein product, partial [Mesorhabditis belari]|uniref:Nas2 N-terminal domain-containing protein n=1 Tax=Mesorhabditis belari TaxID=2138241 RepID=A0AAF3EDR1_9BILA
MDTLKKLVEKREEIDRKLADQREILEASNATMDSPLVDQEGFPIASVDVYSVRLARVEIIRLQNDRKQLEEDILVQLQVAHGDPANDSQSNYPIVHRTSNNTFAKVLDVIPGSPSDVDGLKKGDELLQWGPVHYDVFTNMKDVVDTAMNSESQILRVTVLRKERPIRLEITPRKWRGQGLLGCKLESLKN